MGETLAANCSAQTWWVSAGRSHDTRSRAEAHGMHELASLDELASGVDIVVSICPPAAAETLADRVAASGFVGLFVDANAISPATARSIATKFEHYVDGSVIGPPAHQAGTTRLYLSGDRAHEVADLYVDSALDARVIDGDAGAASALKMAYASWTKIGSALNLAIRALASAEGVDETLVDEWNLSQPGLVERSDRVAVGVSPKAWRFTGEMQQIADAFSAAGLPADFAHGAHEIYDRMADFKGTTGTTLAEVMVALGAIESPDD